MVTVYNNGKQPAFNDSCNYIYVVNKINKIPEGFDTLDKIHYYKVYQVRHKQNIIVTYKEFMYLQHDMLKYLNNYDLVITGVFEPFNVLKIFPDDIKLLEDVDLATVVDNKLIWKKYEYGTSKFDDVEDACRYGDVTVISNTKLFYVFNAKLFSYFKNVNIYTAYFDGQLLKYVLDKYNVKYNIVHDAYEKPNVKVINNDKLDTLGESNKALSENWIKTHTAKTIANPMVNVINKLKKEGKSVVWTTFDDCYNKVSSKGCKKLYKAITSTNKINSDIGVFMMNPLIDKYIKNYFDNNIDEDKYALSTLLRFLYTTNVKEVYIPSNRMKKLLNDFLI